LGARGNFVYSYVWFVFSTPLQEHERPMWVYGALSEP
jgi:hypothetical protein